MAETVREVGDAFGRSEEDLLREWYEVQMRQAVGRSPADLRSLASQDVKASFLAWLDRQGFSDLICREWNYCAKRRDYQDPTFMAAAIADLLLAFGGIAAPINVAVLCVKFYCDRLCKCDQRTA